MLLLAAWDVVMLGAALQVSIEAHFTEEEQVNPLVWWGAVALLPWLLGRQHGIRLGGQRTWHHTICQNCHQHYSPSVYSSQTYIRLQQRKSILLAWQRLVPCVTTLCQCAHWLPG